MQNMVLDYISPYTTNHQGHLGNLNMTWVIYVIIIF